MELLYTGGMIQPNTYFDDHVRSLGYEDADGKATVGVMLVGVFVLAMSLRTPCRPIVEG